MNEVNINVLSTPVPQILVQSTPAPQIAVQATPAPAISVQSTPAPIIKAGEAVTIAPVMVDGQVVTLPAGEVINGGKAVVIESDGKVYVYDIANEGHYGKSVGISKQGALQNELVDVYTGGVAYEAGSGWQAGQLYYVSANGTPSTNYPLSGITKMIGVGIAPDTILLNSSLEFITI